MSDFIHLHSHSHYSLLNALPKIPELVDKAKEYGMPALALTDNGNLYGAIPFYKACTGAGIKPIIGLDAYLATRTRFDKQSGIDNSWHRLVLLSKNMDGYKNLLKLVTQSQLEGFYYKPRIDYELLENHNQGLIAIIPSFSGDIVSALKKGDLKEAKDKLKWYKDVFGQDNIFLEITHHPEINGHTEAMTQVKKFAEETKTSLVATGDFYYLKPEDKKVRDVLNAIQTNRTIYELSGMDSDEDFSFISPTQAKKYFKDTPEAIENTKKIADLCNLELDLGKWVFPQLDVGNGKSHDEALKELTYQGIEKRGMERSEKVIERIEYELKIIKNKGYSIYFLIVSDLLRYAHEKGIFSTIRGSVAGSLVTYLTDITKIDPLKYKLPFERFLNPERPSAPDIDMDFADNRRDEVIQYAREKYGVDKVAQIGTFGTMMARGSVRDVARALGHSYNLGDRIAKQIPMGAQGFPMTIDRAMDEVSELRDMYKKESDAKEIVDMARKIEGCARHISVHAAGVVISPGPLTDYVPLQYDSKGEQKIITQYDMHSVEDAGLIKFDFLGIRNLAILSDSVKTVKKYYGKDIDIENIPIDDAKTFEILARGETVGLFQLNGSGMTRYLMELKPSRIDDINAMVALYRPGPLESIPKYIERKHNPKLVSYLDPRMETILDQSYGVITYQDDVLMIAINLAGYSWLEADKLRKAMGKKIPEEMEAQKKKLISGLTEKGMTEEKAEELWKLIEPFAAYGFNKCLTGDTQIVDTQSSEKITIEEIYKSNKKISVYSLSDSMELEAQKITAVMENGTKEVFLLQTQTSKNIKATANHPFRTMDGWKNLSDLKIGEKIATFSEPDVYWDEIVSIEKAGNEMTYDLTVPPYSNFVANDIIVHNSHAASYGRVAYQTAYLKANYSAVYMASVLTAESGDSEKISEIIDECIRMKIPVLPPDINKSLGGFTVVNNPESKEEEIRFGLYTIKNFGEGVANEIIEERKENGDFKNLTDFITRISRKTVNKKSLEALIKSGALDQFGERGQMLNNVENILNFKKELTEAPQNQDSLFGSIDLGVAEIRLNESKPAKDEDRLAWEKELLGLYISGHPLDKHEDKLKRHNNPISSVKKMREKSSTVIAGIVHGIREIMTKKGERMMFLNLTDREESIDVVVFPDLLESRKDLLVEDSCVAIKGRVSHRNGTASIVAEQIRSL